MAGVVATMRAAPPYTMKRATDFEPFKVGALSDAETEAVLRGASPHVGAMLRQHSEPAATLVALCRNSPLAAAFMARACAASRRKIYRNNRPAWSYMDPDTVADMYAEQGAAATVRAAVTKHMRRRAAGPPSAHMEAAVWAVHFLVSKCLDQSAAAALLCTAAFSLGGGGGGGGGGAGAAAAGTPEGTKTAAASADGGGSDSSSAHGGSGGGGGGGGGGTAIQARVLLKLWDGLARSRKSICGKRIARAQARGPKGGRSKTADTYALFACLQRLGLLQLWRAGGKPAVEAEKKPEAAQDHKPKPRKKKKMKKKAPTPEELEAEDAKAAAKKERDAQKARRLRMAPTTYRDASVVGWVCRVC